MSFSKCLLLAGVDATFCNDAQLSTCNHVFTPKDDIPETLTRGIGIGRALMEKLTMEMEVVLYLRSCAEGNNALDAIALYEVIAKDEHWKEMDMAKEFPVSWKTVWGRKPTPELYN